jgi:hypothetical protein
LLTVNVCGSSLQTNDCAKQPQRRIHRHAVIAGNFLWRSSFIVANTARRDVPVKMDPTEPQPERSEQLENNPRACLWVDSRSRDWFQQRGWNTYESVVNFFTRTQTQPWPKLLLIPPAPAAGENNSPRVFFKLYNYQRDDDAWRKRILRWFWKCGSKARGEFLSYGVFERLGIPCARRVAWGESRDRFGRLRSAFIITQAVPDCVTLPEFFRIQATNTNRSSSGLQRISVVRQLADMTRRIHAVGFFHSDLYGRNVLVSHPPDTTSPRVFWIDCPKGNSGFWPPGKRRRMIKDIAALDLTGVKLASRTERLCFILAYLERQHLDEQARRLIHDVVRYRQSRWPNPTR